MFKQLVLALALIGFSQGPSHSSATITMAGQVYPNISISGSPNQSLTGSSGTLGSATDTQNPTESVNFGDLSTAVGPNAVASFGLRVRGNTACHVTSSVLSYTASNIKYAGTGLVGNSSELAFMSIGSGPISNGSAGNSTGAAYGSRFLGSDTLASLNGGVIGTATTTSDNFLVLSQKPSTSGNITSPNNWVEGTVIYSVPTGAVWECTGGTGSFNIINRFDVFPGA